MSFTSPVAITILSTPTISSAIINASKAIINIGSTPSSATITPTNISPDLTFLSQTLSQILFSGANQGHTYSFSIKASFGTASSISSPATASCLYTPINVLVNAVGNQMSILWNYGPYGTSTSGITFYIIDKNTSTTLNTVTNATSTSFILQNSYSNLSIYIYATDGTNKSDVSDITNVTILPTPVITQDYGHTTSSTIVAKASTNVPVSTSFTATSDTSNNLTVSSISGSTITWTGGSADTNYTGITVNAIYQNSLSTITTNLATAFNPLTISGCLLWLDGTDPNGNGVIPSNNSTVSTWTDKSGNGCNATSYGGNPLFETGTINGVSSVYLSNAPYFLGSVSITGSSFTCFTVATTKSTLPRTDYDQRLISLSTPPNSDWSTPNSSVALFNQVATSKLSTLRNGVLVGSSSILSGIPFLASSQYDGSSGYLWFNGSPGSTPSTASTGTFSVTTYGIGNEAYPQSPETWNGYIGEVLIYNTFLSPLQRESIEGYLAWKWGLNRNLQPTLPFNSNFPASLKTSISSYSPTIWYDGSVVSSIITSSGSNVLTWQNLGSTGSVNDAVTISGYQQATYLSNQKGLYFSNCLYNISYTSAPLEETVFVVFKSGGNSHSGLLCGPDYSRSLLVGEGNNTNYCASYVSRNYNYFAQTPVGSLLPNKINMLTAYADSTSTNIALNGYSFYTSNVQWNLSSASTYLGNQPSGNSATNSYYIGNIYELIIFNYKLLLNDIKKIEGYLTLKWNNIN
jgi:hypothetical protein